jgi:hypothetical protein
MADMPFDVGRPYQVRKSLGKKDKLQTHLRRRVTDDIADAKRRMRLGGLGDRSRLSDSGRGIRASCGCKGDVGERHLILRVRASCTALLVSLFCEANVQSMYSDCS